MSLSFWGPKMLQNQIFRGSAPDLAGRAYGAPPDHLAHCPLPRTPPPLADIRASFLRVSALGWPIHLQSWQSY